jgi:hypothetical protein
MGTQQFFFPRPGEYDLDLEGVEIISPADEYRNYYDRRGDSSLTGYVMDNGEIEVPRMKTGSLSFKEAKMQQRLRPNWVLPSNLEVKKASRGVRVTGTIMNDSPNAIVSGSLIVGDALPIVAVRRLEPGETVDVNVLVVLNGDPPEYIDTVFEAVMPDLKVGASLGDAVAGRAISIVCGMGTYRVEAGS